VIGCIASAGGIRIVNAIATIKVKIDTATFIIRFLLPSGTRKYLPYWDIRGKAPKRRSLRTTEAGDEGKAAGVSPGIVTFSLTWATRTTMQRKPRVRTSGYLLST
jgi:hypothetical protein